MKKKTFEQIKKLVHNIEVDEQNEAVFIFTVRESTDSPDINMATYGNKDILTPNLASVLNAKPVVKSIFMNALAIVAQLEAIKAEGKLDDILRNIKG